MINVARAFSRYPGGRYRSRSEFSGEQFREEVLVPALRFAVDHDSKIVVELSGTAGYAMSFLEEAFGGLVRVSGYSPEFLDTVMSIVASDPSDIYFLGKAKQFIREASPLPAIH